MESKSTVNTSSFGKAYHDPKRVDIKLLAIDKLADTILQEFDPEALEQGINAYAEEGWEVISIATATIPGITGAREEMIVVFERNK